jgi:ATP synthase protein I
MTNTVGRAWGPDEADDASFKALTPEEAKALRAKLPMVSPWRVVGVQALVGLLCAALIWAITQRSSAAWSALYGALSVVLPGALMARGMTRGTRSPVGAAVGFWEMLKIAVAITLLVIAARVVPHLSWPALLITMVVCMKVNWLALAWRGRQ